MGIFNLGGIAGAYSTGIPKQKSSFWNKLKGGISSFEKEYNAYPPLNVAGQNAGLYPKAMIKKNNLPLYIGIGTVALIGIYFIMK